MDVITCYKLSPDNQDMQINPDYTVSFDRAEWIIGDFDLVAIEAGAQIAAMAEASHKGLCVGPTALSNKKARKNALSRGLDSLTVVMDDSLWNADTNLTASIIAAAVRKDQECRIVICGEGSADFYYRQTGMQLGELLGWPAINGISKVLEIGEASVTALRTTEDSVQKIVIPLPAVLSVTADYAPSRIPTMKDILSAGKKPVEEVALEDLGSFESKVQIDSILAPKSRDRKGIIIDAAVDEAVDLFVEHLAKEGLV